jgi:hypothetical protein
VDLQQADLAARLADRVRGERRLTLGHDGQKQRWDVMRPRRVSDHLGHVSTRLVIGSETPTRRGFEDEADPLVDVDRHLVHVGLSVRVLGPAWTAIWCSFDRVPHGGLGVGDSRGHGYQGQDESAKRDRDHESNHGQCY